MARADRGVFASSPKTFSPLGEQLRRLRRLSDDLSSLSLAHEQRLDLHPVDAHLADPAHGAVARLSPHFRESFVTLNVDADSPLPVMWILTGSP